MYYLSGCPRAVNLHVANGGEPDEQGEFAGMAGLARRFRKSLSVKSVASAGTSETGPDTDGAGTNDQPPARELGIDALLAGANALTRPGPLALRQSPDNSLIVSWDRRSFCIWCTRPVALLARVVRDSETRRTHGENQDIMWKPDGLALAVITTNDYVLYYSVDLLSESSLRFHFSGEHNFVRGPGEGRGVPGCIVQFAGALHIDEGILCGAGMDDALYVATRDPPGLRRCSLGEERGGYTRADPSSELTPLSQLNFMSDPDALIQRLIYNDELDLLAMLMSDGCVYVARRVRVLAEHPIHGSYTATQWNGWCCHDGEPAAATCVQLNAFYNLAAVGTEAGQVHVYRLPENSTDQPKLSHTLDVPAYSSVKTNCVISALAWSSDGCALAVGRRRGVGLVVHSVFGSLLFHPGREALSADDQGREAFLRGTDYLFWGPGDHDLFTWPSSLDDPSLAESLYILPFAISNIAKCQTLDNTKHPLLYADHKLMLFSSDLQVQDEVGPDTFCRQIQLPALYISENWPLRYAALSDDGRRISVAGRAGVAHYSVPSRRWKTFGSKQQEQEFVCYGGMLWFHDILVAACHDLVHQCFQLRFYPRDANLGNEQLLLVELLAAQAVHLNLLGSSLTVHCTDNVVYHYGIHVNQAGGVELSLRQHISLESVVTAAGAVRSICWISTGSRGSTVLVLVDGELILVNPNKVDENSQKLQYERRTLAKRVEHCFVDDRRVGGVGLTVWAMSADEIRVWTVLEKELADTDIDTAISRFPPCVVSPGFSPLVVRVEEGVVVGFEPEMNYSDPLGVTNFRASCKSYLYLPDMIRHLLTINEQEAIMFARYYQHQKYFSHILEMMLHRVLEDEAEGDLQDQEPLLPRVIQFLKRFPNYHEVVVQCARKVEVSLWDHLFSMAGPPRELFDECMESNQLRTATAYLLVLQTLDSTEETSSEPPEKIPPEAMRLLERAVDARDFDLSKDIVRFVTSLMGPEMDMDKLMAHLEADERGNTPVPSSIDSTPLTTKPFKQM
ncbi:RIC1-domain-containing protein [Thamnocephalis sphaerospora]|uniref:RIC1-domain-containing protein n=1 Tax=Thamnocephalis sphaerospora TaxID=78915 RepID=A0A4P9XT61_9FUNG|nr:RIC1-domain-containing protein [Thamnocephalis sphaerospora]|eukprot:RKP09355.1 RIC1-domain-containing protein [Thamnocephalis sphaerospora]